MHDIQMVCLQWLYVRLADPKKRKGGKGPNNRGMLFHTSVRGGGWAQEFRICRIKQYIVVYIKRKALSQEQRDDNQLRGNLHETIVARQKYTHNI